MSPLTSLRIAGGALARHKLRSFLTVLGIVIGIAAVIAMVAVGQGARARVKAVFASLGTNLLVVMPGAQTAGGVMGQAGSASTITWGDLEAIRTELPSVRAAAPVLQSRAQVASDETNWNTTIYGTTPDYFVVRAWATTRGRVFDADELAGGAKVAVIGGTVAEKLFGSSDPVGQMVRIKNTPVEIIGLLAKKGQSPMGQDYDDVVLLPARTYQAKIEGSLGTYLKGVLFVSATSEDDTGRAQERVTALLRDRHKLADGADDDFTVRNLSEFAQAQQQSTDTITALLAAVAAVSLLVGGIGIMNIMLVSVVERTREIGLRMAVGASPAALLLQFLTESLLLAAVGGLLGLAVGGLAAYQMAAGLGWATIFPRETALVAVAVSAAIGVIFGLYPAIKASRLDPIAALRYEP